MHYIKLTLTDNRKTLVNLHRADNILPNKMNNFRNVQTTIISFGSDDNYIEVLEPLEDIERIMRAGISEVNYHD